MSYWLWIAVKKTFAILAIIVGLGFGYFAYIDFSVEGAVLGLMFLSFGYAWLFNKTTNLTKDNSLKKVEDLSAKDFSSTFARYEDIDLSSVTIWGWVLLAVVFFVFFPLFAAQLFYVAGKIDPTWDTSLFLWWLLMTVAILGSALFFLACKNILEKIGIKILR